MLDYSVGDGQNVVTDLQQHYLETLFAAVPASSNVNHLVLAGLLSNSALARDVDARSFSSRSVR